MFGWVDGCVFHGTVCVPCLSIGCRPGGFRHARRSMAAHLCASHRPSLAGQENPQEADAGTIRADFAVSIDANAVHGSDSEESAIREINYFFKDEEIISK